MEKQDKRRRFTILELAGMMFLLHHIGILTPVILSVSALAAILAILGLVIDIHPVKRLLRRLLRSMEGRWSSLCEQIEHHGTGSWSI